MDVTHGVATNYVLRYCVRVRRLIALTIFSAFRRYNNFFNSHVMHILVAQRKNRICLYMTAK